MPFLEVENRVNWLEMDALYDLKREERPMKTFAFWYVFPSNKDQTSKIYEVYILFNMVIFIETPHC